MDFLENIPVWLRWILFLPVAFVAFSLAYPIIKIGNLILSFGEFEGLLGQAFLSALAGGWSGFVFVWVGAKVAPKAQFVVSIILAIIIALLGGMSIMARLYLGDASSVSWIELLVSLVAGLVGAIGACYSFYEEAIRDL